MMIAVFLLVTLAATAAADNMDTIHELVWNHDKITRTWNATSTGIESYTWSSDPTIVAAIQRHVREMKALKDNGGVIRMCDPLFRAVFARRDDIELSYSDVSDGVRVHEWSKSANNCTAELIQWHAHAVSLFVKEGPPQVRMCRPHEAPPCTQTQQQASADTAEAGCNKGSQNQQMMKMMHGRGRKN